MAGSKVYTAIGLMSGTSLDGVDAALIRTDGEDVIERLSFISLPYDDEMRAMLRKCFGRREDVDGFVARAANALTEAHAGAVDWLLAQAGRAPGEADLIGFHGQTVAHDPAARFTWQIGNAPMLARLTGINVVADFRMADVAAGGQGAPLLPLYHAALARAASAELPLAVLNLGGVGNVTWIGADGAVVAFDTGPGNALIDDWVLRHLGRPYDENGLLARQGTVRQDRVAAWLAQPFFAAPPPKSLDRDAWRLDGLDSLSAADGAATLTAFTVQAAAQARRHFPEPAALWLVTGGGRHNNVIMEGLQTAFNVPVRAVDSVGWDGDAMEAEGFAYLAVRSLRGLPLSLPTTTGVPAPLTGGRLYPADSAKAAAS